MLANGGVPKKSGVKATKLGMYFTIRNRWKMCILPLFYQHQMSYKLILSKGFPEDPNLEIKGG